MAIWLSEIFLVVNSDGNDEYFFDVNDVPHGPYSSRTEAQEMWDYYFYKE